MSSQRVQTRHQWQQRRLRRPQLECVCLGQSSAALVLGLVMVGRFACLRGKLLVNVTVVEGLRARQRQLRLSPPLRPPRPLPLNLLLAPAEPRSLLLRFLEQRQRLPR